MVSFPTENTDVAVYLEDGIDSWHTVSGRKLQDVTVQNYKALVDTYLKPRFGVMKMKDVDPVILEEILRDPFLGRTRSVATRHKFLRIVSELFWYAYLHNLVPLFDEDEAQSLVALTDEIEAMLDARREAEAPEKTSPLFKEYALEVFQRIYEDPNRARIRSETTLQSHRLISKKHLSDLIGNIPVHLLTDDNENLQLVVERIAQHRVRKTRQKRIHTLSLVLREAVRDGHLDICPAIVNVQALTNGKTAEDSGFTPLFKDGKKKAPSVQAS